MKNKILSVMLITTFLISSLSGIAVASSVTQDAENKKNQAQNSLNELEEQMQQWQQQQQQLQAQMDAAEQELVELMVSVDLIKIDIEDKEQELVQVQEDLEVAKENEKNQYEAMKLRIQYMYEQGDTAFIEAILGATSMADLINQVEYFEEVYSYDRRLLVSYQEAKIQTEELQEQVKLEVAELKGMQESLESEQKSLEAVVAKLQSQDADFNSKLASAQQKADSYKKTIVAQNEIIKEEAKRQKELEEAAAAAAAAQNNNSNNNSSNNSNNNNNNNSGGGSSGGGDHSGEPADDPGYATSVTPGELIEYAKQFIGCEYVWGGTDPHTGADCSGYIQYVYKHFGINIPRTSYLQRTAGKAVSFENAQQGDIICYDGHVALYLGNNQILHARGREYGICITDNAKYKPIITIRRVL